MTDLTPTTTPTTTPIEDVFAPIKVQLATRLAVINTDLARLEHEKDRICGALAIINGEPATAPTTDVVGLAVAALPVREANLREHAASTTRRTRKQTKSNDAPANTSTLRETMINVLRRGPMSASDIATAIREAGYVSRSTNVRQLVYVALSRGAEFRKGKGGLWSLKAGA